MSDIDKRLKELRDKEKPKSIDERLAEIRNPTKYEEGAEPWYEDLAEGIATSGIKTWQGLREIDDLIANTFLSPFTDKQYGSVTEEDKAMLADWRADSEQSLAGTVGEIVGDTAQYAIPSTMAFKGAKALDTGWKGLLGLEASANALFGGMRGTEGDETRLSNALSDGIGAGLGVVGGRALEKIGEGFKRTEAGQKLIDLVPEHNFNAASVLENPFFKSTQNAAEQIPFLARKANKSAKADLDNWNLALLREAAPNPKGITKTGNEGFDQLDRQINEGYKEAWDQAGEIPPSLPPFLAQYNEMLKGNYTLRDNEKILDDLLEEAGDYAARGTERGFKGLDASIKDIKYKLDPTSLADRNLKKALDDLSGLVKESIPQRATDSLKELDRKFPLREVLNDAVRSSTRKEKDGIFTPKEVLAGVDNQAINREFASGRGPLSDLAKVGSKAFRDPEIKSDGGPISYAWNVLKAMPGLGWTRPKVAGRMATGQAFWQPGLKRAAKSEAARSLFPALGASMGPEIESLFDTSWMDE